VSGHYFHFQSFGNYWELVFSNFSLGGMCVCVRVRACVCMYVCVRTLEAVNLTDDGANPQTPSMLHSRPCM
jgi:hypothetical protein